jgi:hypothetical protein
VGYGSFFHHAIATVSTKGYAECFWLPFKGGVFLMVSQSMPNGGHRSHVPFMFLSECDWLLRRGVTSDGLQPTDK